MLLFLSSLFLSFVSLFVFLREWMGINIVMIFGSHFFNGLGVKSSTESSLEKEKENVPKVGLK